MSHFYILATGILTQGPMLTGPKPEPPLLPPEPLPVWSKANNAEFFEQVATHQTIPSLEFSTPEFSQMLQPALNELSPTISEIGSVGGSLPSPNLMALSTIEWLPQLTPESFTPELGVKNSNFKSSEIAFIRPETSRDTTEFSQVKNLHPASGTQLYYQRVAALEAGQIYTRLAADKFYSSWAKANQKPTYEQWKHLLGLEAQAIASGQGANRLGVLVGDSLTQWFPQEGLPTGSLWLNQGISGDNSSGILKRLSAFSQTKPDAIYILAGINDLRQGATDQIILNNLQQIVRRLRWDHPQAKLIVQSILPTRLSTIPNNRIRNLNQQIALLTQQEGASYLDLHSHFTDAEGNLRENLTTDGLHLNMQGYEIWQSTLKNQWFVTFNRQKPRAVIEGSASGRNI